MEDGYTGRHRRVMTAADDLRNLVAGRALSQTD